ncbi:MAG: LPS assembly protein LptD [Lysobacteraceae bacterium]
MRKKLRLLPLPFCIALSLSAQAADDAPEDWGQCPIEDAVPAFIDRIPAAENPPSGSNASTASDVTEVNGDRMTGTEGQIVDLDGNVNLRRGDQVLLADKLSYDQDKETYTAEGSVRYQDRGMRLIAARAKGDQGKDTHELEDIQYQLIRRRGNGGAKRIVMQGDEGSLYGSTYSTCPPEARRWELRAQRIDVNTAEGMGTAHNATLRVGRIPVLYLPWFRFPIDDRRRTGLLYPAISSSSRNGFDWRQPIYLNLAPNYDATITPRLMTKRGLQLGGEFRYLTETGRGVLDAAYLPSDNLTDRERDAEIAAGVPATNRRVSNRGYLRFLGSQNLGPNWQARSNIAWISDTRYLDDASHHLNGGAASFVTSDIGVYGRGRNWEASILADHWQLADYTLRDANLPFDRLPRGQVHWEQAFAGRFAAGIDAEVVRFDHPELAGGSRLDLKPYVSLPLEGDSWFLKPSLAWRYTGYALESDSALPGRDDRPSRSLPIATLDAGLYFDRHTRWGDSDYLNTLEPRIFYFNAPYRDQSGVPLFDTRPLTFGWGQLFRDNRYSGADRQADGNQLTLAVSTRLIREADGHEKLSASIGQIRYFEDSRVTVPGESPIEQGKSAWIMDTNYAPNDRWTIGASYQWDPKAGRRDLASLRTRYLIGDEGIVNLSYRYRRDLLEQADLSFLYPINPNWSVVGRYYYSLQDDQLLEGIAGVQWESCCLAVRLVGRRYLRSRSGDLNNAIQLEIELKGLGSAGPDTEGRLRRAILGYYREDLSLVPPPQSRGGGDLPSSDLTP